MIYHTIYNYKKRKVALSGAEGEGHLQMTNYSKKEEILFYKVEDVKKKEQIERQSEAWRILPDSDDCDYYIYEQGNESGKFIEIIKIKKKTEGRENDWIYYAYDKAEIWEGADPKNK